MKNLSIIIKPTKTGYRWIIADIEPNGDIVPNGNIVEVLILGDAPDRFSAFKTANFELNKLI